ncbi:Integrin alpha-7, partial [Camelus dromedarius]
MVFSCPLYSFDRAAVLHVWGRLWNSTFLEEYSAVKSLEVIVRANITVKSSIKNLLLRDASTVIPVMVYLDPVAVVAEGVPWWVILLAVLAGLLVLALLVLLMWKQICTEPLPCTYQGPCRALDGSEIRQAQILSEVFIVSWGRGACGQAQGRGTKS